MNDGAEKPDLRMQPSTVQEETPFPAGEFIEEGEVKLHSSEVSERLQTKLAVIGKDESSNEGNKKKRSSAYAEDLLKSRRVNCHQMKWQLYEKSIRSPGDDLFDMICTDPPYGLDPNAAGSGKTYLDHLDDKDMSSFSQFSFRVLKPGGYIFIFTSVRYMQKWITAPERMGSNR